MYPYFYIGSFKVYMTGLGIIVGILVFITFVYKYSKRYGLNFWKFFNWLPAFIIIPYLFGTYFSFIMNNGDFIPLSLGEFLSIISPYGYKISFIGMSFGILVSFALFFRTVAVKAEIFKWIDVFFYAISIALIPLGVFLLLGDNFIGNTTESIVGVSSFIEDSELSKYTKVYPVGIFVTILGIMSFMFTFLFHYIRRSYGLGFFGLAFLLFGFNIIFLFQQYTAHLVLNVFGITFDIKNYWTLLLLIILFYYYYVLNKDKGK